MIRWIEQTSAAARRTVSVCTGAFLLARAGLLAGRRATTHWASAEALASAHPEIEVDPDPIFIRDGSLWTSAGVTAGMDLALALVEEDHDRELALTIARHLVLFLRRPGSQSQFSAALGSQPARGPREIQRSVLEEPAASTRSRRWPSAHMSTRHFARAFAAETASRRALRRARAPGAARLLEETSEPIEVLAAQAGFPSAETCAWPSSALSASHRSVPPPLSGLPAAGGAPTPERTRPMDIAIVLYDRFTALDAVGPYEVLSRVPGAQLRFLAVEPGPVRTDNGVLTVLAEHGLDEVPRPEVIVVPGGPGEVAARAGGRLLEWLRRAHATSTWTTSVCTGSLILAAAGLLQG